MNINQWFKRFEEFENFVEASGRRPSRSDTAPDQERYIAYWLKDQIKYYKSGKLDPKLYEMIENVLSDSKTKLDLAWETTYEELSYFLRDNEGRAPKRETNEQETRLAYWVKDQRKYHDKNILSDDRIEKLDLLKEKYGFDWRLKGRIKESDAKFKVKSITRDENLAEVLSDNQNVSIHDKSR